MVYSSNIQVNSFTLYIQIGIHMQFIITLDTDNTLLHNLNTIEDSLRQHNIMSTNDNLIAITDNPIHPQSITLRDDVVISAVGDQISVVNPKADINMDEDDGSVGC